MHAMIQRQRTVTSVAFALALAAKCTAATLSPRARTPQPAFMNTCERLVPPDSSAATGDRRILTTAQVTRIGNKGLKTGEGEVPFDRFPTATAIRVTARFCDSSTPPDGTKIVGSVVVWGIGTTGEPTISIATDCLPPKVYKLPPSSFLEAEWCFYV